MNVRVSLATASLLGLKNCKLDAKPTTLYFMIDGSCKGNCLYCYQKNGYLARIKWPSYNLEKIKENMADMVNMAKAERICIQSLYGDEYMNDLLYFVKEMKKFNIPISASINAIDREKMKILKETGVERVGIGLDCSSPEIFEKWKRNVPSWNEYMDAVKNAKEIFGSATCHLIVGLGESDEEAIKIMEKMAKMKVKIALFPYSRGNETVISLPRYRALQIAHHIIEEGKGKILFEGGKIAEMVTSFPEKAFYTTGCPYCNRPFYNERVSKIYNYPYKIDKNVIEEAIREAKKYARIYIASE